MTYAQARETDAACGKNMQLCLGRRLGGHEHAWQGRLTRNGLRAIEEKRSLPEHSSPIESNCGPAFQ